jgi:hypothetical protein
MKTHSTRSFSFKILMPYVLIIYIGFSTPILGQSSTTDTTTFPKNNQLACINTNEFVCSTVLKKYPNYCSTPGAKVQGVPFDIYCAKSCKNCLKCVDRDPIRCDPSNIEYCLLQTFVGAEPFVSYCSVLCNFCKATTTNPTTIKNNNVTVSSITTAPSLSSSTTPNACQDMDPKICSNYSTSYCLTMTYVGKIPYAKFCQKTCNICKKGLSSKFKELNRI